MRIIVNLKSISQSLLMNKGPKIQQILAFCLEDVDAPLNLMRQESERTSFPEPQLEIDQRACVPRHDMTANDFVSKQIYQPKASYCLI